MIRVTSNTLILLSLLMLSILGSGCSEKGGQTSEVPAPGLAAASNSVAGTSGSVSNAAPKTFQVNGILKEVDLAKRKLRILHDEIPDYMPKMTMVFEVRDGSKLEDLKVGEQLRFKMMVTEEDGWIEQVQPTGAKVTTTGAGPTNRLGTMRLVKNVDPLFPGDALPDMTFTNELGKVVKWSDYKGKTFAFTYIFTTCPFPTMCPKMSFQFRDAAKELASKDSIQGDWHLFSITIDPARDTPSVLKQYGEGHGYVPERWSFLTAPLEDVESFGRQFGLNFAREEGALNHNLRTVVVGPGGKVHHILIGNEWTVEELVKEMKAAALAGPGKP